MVTESKRQRKSTKPLERAKTRKQVEAWIVQDIIPRLAYLSLQGGAVLALLVFGALGIETVLS